MKRNIGAILFSVILISVITFPFLWLLLGSFKTMKELFSVPIRFFPEHISLDNYIAVFKAQPFGLYLYNSFVIALLGTVLVVVASAMRSVAQVEENVAVCLDTAHRIDLAELHKRKVD